MLARPISFYSACLPSGHCGATGSTEQEVLAIGTPLIWWGALAALTFCLAWWLMRRDWRTGALLLATAAGWLPWIWFYLHDQRTEFYYYAIAFEPYLIIAITLSLGLIIGPRRASPARRATGAVTAGTYLLAILPQPRLPLPHPRRPDHPLQLLVLPHVVPQLDLSAPSANHQSAHRQ